VAKEKYVELSESCLQTDLRDVKTAKYK